MTVKIITDSVSDLPTEAATELGITVVPLSLRSGTIAPVSGDKE